jgi:hypothetical protein
MSLAAAVLGITVEELQRALNFPPAPPVEPATD